METKNLVNTQELKQSTATIKYKQELEEKMEKIIAGIVGKRFATAKMIDFPVVLRDLHKTKEGLFIYGQCGVGKTHLMAAITRETILNAPPKIEFDTLYRDDAYTPAFMSIPKLLMKIRSCYNRNDVSEEKLLDYYTNEKILMLDDLGVEKPTEWVLQTLCLIIDQRYQNMKKTIISSNYNLDQIAKRLDDRISSRIMEMCQIVQINGKDKRKENKHG